MSPVPERFAAAYPEPPPERELREVLGLMRRGRLGSFGRAVGGLDLARSILREAGSIAASADPAGFRLAVDDFGLGSATPGAPRACAFRAFVLPDPGARVALGCALWKGRRGAPAESRWEIWRRDAPAREPFFRSGDFDDVKILVSTVMAAALPHPDALRHFAESEDGGPVDEWGALAPPAERELRLRVAAWIDARSIAEAAGPARSGAEPRRI